MADNTAKFNLPIVPTMIHRPDVPRHMMHIKTAGRRITIHLNDAVIAQSASALQLIEIGHDVYDPVYYLPVADVQADIAANDKTTYCPLKGNTTYYDLAAASAGEYGRDIGWVYSAPLAFAAELAGHIAFDPARVTVISAPL